MGCPNSITPKEGAGRSNRLGDANNIRHLQGYLVGAFSVSVKHSYFIHTFTFCQLLDYLQQKAGFSPAHNSIVH